MQLYLLLCCFPRVTRLKSLSLHLNTFNQFPIQFETRLQTKKHANFHTRMKKLLYKLNLNIVDLQSLRFYCYIPNFLV